MKKATLHANIRQLPVGQGGFLVGQIKGDSARVFTYAFDCGSINSEHFKQGLDFCAPSKIDILFVSHLDIDHINGIDALAAHTQIDTVILPCLDELHVTMIACEATGEVGMRVLVRSFLADSSAWLADRGVKHILHLQRADGTAESRPFNPDDERLNDEIELNNEGSDTTLPYTIRSQGASEETTLRSGTVRVRTLGENTSIITGAGRGAAAWMLIPYVHPFPAINVELFRRAVAGLLSRPFTGRMPASKPFTKKLMTLLLDEASRDQLKRCYLFLSNDNNKPSLSLYSGPLPAVANALRIDRSDEPFYPFYRSPHLKLTRGRPPANRGGAWLSTGDANLQTKATKNPWLQRFGNLLDQVEVFTLPHHGSHRSIHEEVLIRMKGSMMLACAVTGSAKHPHPMLLARLHGHAQTLWQVSEEAESGFTLDVIVQV
ncbi:hypothetical protein [Pseudomonas prosekii]|uniref:hypothetical protein n=1 Tax=Pseudomonas prosekii TaxID=1148509 RepID=UPI00387A8617